MQNYYQILGINSSATKDEIRRAYRILARRYHPDVNPEADSGNRFKEISEAYRVLSDDSKRAQFDHELDKYQKRQAFDSYQTYNKNARSQFKAQSRYFEAQKAAREELEKRKQQQKPKVSKSRKELNVDPFAPVWKNINSFSTRIKSLLKSEIKFLKGSSKPARPSGVKDVKKLSIIEVSVSMNDAILGIRKTVEVSEPEGGRRISVKIPPGVQNGSVIRLQNRSKNAEELVLVIRVAQHPFMRIERKGLIVEVPITVKEALFGANVSLPTLEDPYVVKIPAGTQSGNELRLKSKGIKLKDGSRGDLFYRFMIRIPESQTAVGIKELTGTLEQYYESPVRRNFPNTLI